MRYDHVASLIAINRAYFATGSLQHRSTELSFEVRSTLASIPGNRSKEKPGKSQTIEFVTGHP
jgi:hypothetical protein